MSKDKGSVEQKAAELQLAEIREQRARLAAEKAKRDQEKQLSEELEREKQALLDDEALAKLEAEHPASKIKAITTPIGLVVVQRPRAPEYQRFIDNEITQAKAAVFVSHWVLYPVAQRFGAMIEELPGIVPEILNAVVELAGAGRAKREGK